MWVFVDKGFYSAVVDDDDPELLVVRTRARADADYLVKWIKREHGVAAEVVVLKRVTDYPWRVYVDRQVWGSFLVDATETMNYGNFKSRVHDVNERRAQVYSSVWATLLRIENEDRPAVKVKASVGSLFTPAYLGTDDELDEEHGALVRSIHDMTDAEWRELMEEAPVSAGSSARGRRKKRGKKR